MRGCRGALLVAIAFAGVAACGSVTEVEDDGGAGSSGNAGTAGPGTAGAGGGSVAGAGGSGTGIAGMGGRSGSDGRGGTDGTGTAGRGGAGGLAAGGRGGGGGLAMGGRGGGAGGGMAGINGGNAGRGGTVGGGIAGAGGGAAAGRGGTAGSAVGGAGGLTCQRGACPALLMSDLIDLDPSGINGFATAGQRCKSLTICGLGSQSCIYYATDMLGSRNSMDPYMDGIETMTPMPAKLVLQVGAASQCGNPAITIVAGETIVITFDGGKKISIYMPAFTGVELTLYIASDGSTYYDAALTMPARLRPP